MAINLIPPAAKKDFRFEELNRHLMFFGELSFSVLVFLATILLGEVFFAQWKLQALNARIAHFGARPEIGETKQFEQQLRTFKSEVSRANALATRHVSTFTIFQNLVGHVPNDVILSSVAIDVPSKHITFSGLAPTRDSLLLLRDALKKDTDHYVNIDFPLANLLHDANIQFTMTVSLKAPS